MKVAVVGCGAVGSYYGARLARAGHDVHFLLRSDYEAVKRDGVRIESKDGHFHVRPVSVLKPEEIGLSDLVLIGLKTTANDQFPDLLPPLVGAHTTVLTLQNGLGNVEQLAALFPARQILGGLCFVCLNRVAPGVIRHLDYGLVVVGELAGLPTARSQSVRNAFVEANVPCRLTDDLGRALWEKLVWNIPFNGLGVAAAAGIEAVLSGRFPRNAALGPCLSTDVLLAEARWAALVKALMMEVIQSACALGFHVSETLADQQIERTRTMGAYKASTLLDFERGLPLELESILVEPLRRARAAGIATPRLAALVSILQAVAEQRERPVRPKSGS